jgi:hypothetical protein
MDFQSPHHPAIEKAYELNQKMQPEDRDKGSNAKIEITVSE